MEALAGADITAALADEESEDSLKSDSPSEKERQRKRKLIEDWSSTDEEDPHAVEAAKFGPVDISIESTDLIRLWLAKARQNIRHPVLSDWVSHINEVAAPRDVVRPQGFRQRSTFIAAGTILDRSMDGGAG